MFKALIGKGHEEFSTMRQQDSEEFFSHFLTTLRRQAKATSGSSAEDPTEVFKFGLEQRLQCETCRRVRYRVDGSDVLSVPVPQRERQEDPTRDADDRTAKYQDVRLEECLDIFAGIEQLEYYCPNCKNNVQAMKYVPIITLPELLLLLHTLQTDEVGDVSFDPCHTREEVPASRMGANEAGCEIILRRQ